MHDHTRISSATDVEPSEREECCLGGAEVEPMDLSIEQLQQSQTATHDDKPKSSRHISAQTNMTGKRIEVYRTKMDTLTRKCKKQQLALKKLRDEVATLRKDKKKTSQLLRESNVTTLLVRLLFPFRFLVGYTGVIISENDS